MSFTEKLTAQGKEAVLEKLRGAGLREYGTLNENLYEKICRTVQNYQPVDGPMLAAGGLNNHDFSGMLLSIVKEEPDKVLKGLQVIGWLTDAQKLYLYLPAGEEALAEDTAARAAALNIPAEIVCDLVNARQMRDGITCHVETLKAVTEVLEGTYEPRTLVSVVKYTTSEELCEIKAPGYVDFGTGLAGLLGSLEGIKAVGVGDVLYTPAEAEKMLLTPETALGDGVLRLYGEGCCMLHVTEKALLESRKKSCGKCTFCREGLLQLHTRMKENTGGKGTAAGLDVMKDIAEAMTFSCSCTLGNFGSRLTLETLEKFANEYHDHVSGKKCTAESCLAFVNMYIDPKKCTGCGKCVPVCEGDFIEGMPEYIHMIEDLDCIKCGKCMEVCPEEAIVRTTGNVPRLPDRLTRVGRFKRY